MLETVAYHSIRVFSLVPANSLFGACAIEIRVLDERNECIGDFFGSLGVEYGREFIKAPPVNILIEVQ